MSHVSSTVRKDLFQLLADMHAVHNIKKEINKFVFPADLHCGLQMQLPITVILSWLSIGNGAFELDC